MLKQDYSFNDKRASSILNIRLNFILQRSLFKRLGLFTNAFRGLINIHSSE